MWLESSNSNQDSTKDRMATLYTNSETLRTEALPNKNESKTIISQWIDAITTEVSKGNIRTPEGFTGPTISARFYSMVGTAAYEAWQATETSNQSTVGLKNQDTNLQNKNFVENLITSTILKIVKSKHSGVTKDGRANFKDFSDRARNNSKSSSLTEDLSKKIAKKILKFYKKDGYDMASDYTPINSLERIEKIEFWTPEFNASDDPSSGLQEYLTPQWGQVKPFGISKSNLSSLTALAESPEQFLTNTNDSYDLNSATVTDGITGESFSIDASLIGSYINPEFIKQANNVIEYSQELTDSDQGKILKGTAEFWEDGYGTPFPPGTWLVIGQLLSLENNFDIGQDAKLFQGLGASVHAAAISAWDLKLKENYARPVRVIRELSKLGLVTDLDPKTEGSQFFSFNRETGNVALINGVDFETYQLPGGGYSPPFAEYTSGHSTFSSASAEFLSQFSGTTEFPWAIEFELTFPFGIDKGQHVILEYETFKDAAAAAGNSRLWGGIHFDDGNDNGLKVGEAIGAAIFENLSHYWS